MPHDDKPFLPPTRIRGEAPLRRQTERAIRDVQRKISDEYVPFSGGTFVGDVSFDGRVLLADGTPANPSLAFQLDLDTGIFLSAADELAITVGGTDFYTFQVGKFLFRNAAKDRGFDLIPDWPRITFLTDHATDPYIEGAGTTGKMVIRPGGGVPLELRSPGVANADGSAANPSYTFTSDLDTGIYRTATDNSIGFATGGVRRFAIFTNILRAALPLDFADVAASSARQIFLDGVEGYSFYADNTGQGSDLSRFWLDTPDQGEVVIGPRTSTSYLHTLRLRQRNIQMDFEDSGGDEWSHSFPKGIIYDWGYAEDTTLPTISNTETEIISATINLPANISVTVLVWALLRLDFSRDQVYIWYRTFAAGAPTTSSPSLEELDLTTSTNAQAGSSHSHNLAATQQVWDSIGGAHTFADSHTNESSHTHSHSHTLSSQWTTIYDFGSRSYTPTGSTATVAAKAALATATSQALSAARIMWMVIVN